MRRVRKKKKLKEDKCYTPSINHTDVIFNDKDLPICCGLWAFGTPWMSSLNDTDFSNETDLSEINENENFGEKENREKNVRDEK